MADILSIYHQLPYPLRVLAASLKGLQLRHLRYGPETDQLVQAAIERETWSEQQWSDWQAERLARILHKAATEVPYYRDQWQQRRQQGDYSSWTVLENWPVLQKDALREDPKHFICDTSRIKGMYCEHTSGTTGTPLTLWQSKKTLRQAYAIFDARVRRWHGVSLHDRWGIIGGQKIVKPDATSPPFWVWNQAFNQLYLSSYHISLGNAESYYHAIRDHKLTYIIAYPSALAILAQMFKALHLSEIQLKLVISNAEPLFGHQKALIEEVFCCRVINTYGLSELSTSGSECEADQLHLWPEFGLVEIMALDKDRVVPDEQVGRIITTGLINDDMPLIRYQVGDLGSVTHEQCSCGRSLPILNNIEGRIDDVLVSLEGRLIGRMDPIFKADLPIKEAQIIQEKNNQVRLKFAPGPGFKHEAELISLLQEKLGPMRVILEKVDQIPREPNGKFKAVIRSKEVRLP